jgi:hypothetical protein
VPFRTQLAPFDFCANDPIISSIWAKICRQFCNFISEINYKILFLGNIFIYFAIFQKHIDFVKSTAPNNVDALYAATLLQNLEVISRPKSVKNSLKKNIKNLLPSVTKTAPLIQMILDEDSEEELERLLDAHLHFKQECEQHRGTCKRVDIASAEREKVRNITKYALRK